jgi:hypothetical protein
MRLSTCALVALALTTIDVPRFIRAPGTPDRGVVTQEGVPEFRAEWASGSTSS